MWSTACSAVDAFFHLHWISETWHGLCSSAIPSGIISDNFENFAIKSNSKLCYLFKLIVPRRSHTAHHPQSTFFDILQPNWNMQVSSHSLRISLVAKHRLWGRFKYYFKAEFIQYRTISFSNCYGMATRSN